MKAREALTIYNYTQKAFLVSRFHSTNAIKFYAIIDALLGKLLGICQAGSRSCTRGWGRIGTAMLCDVEINWKFLQAAAARRWQHWGINLVPAGIHWEGAGGIWGYRWLGSGFNWGRLSFEVQARPVQSCLKRWFSRSLRRVGGRERERVHGRAGVCVLRVSLFWLLLKTGYCYTGIFRVFPICSYTFITVPTYIVYVRDARYQY